MSIPKIEFVLVGDPEPSRYVEMTSSKIKSLRERAAKLFAEAEALRWQLNDLMGDAESLEKRADKLEKDSAYLAEILAPELKRAMRCRTLFWQEREAIREALNGYVDRPELLRIFLSNALPIHADLYPQRRAA